MQPYGACVMVAVMGPLSSSHYTKSHRGLALNLPASHHFNHVLKVDLISHCHGSENLHGSSMFNMCPYSLTHDL